jgi:hypothetical protein
MGGGRGSGSGGGGGSSSSGGNSNTAKDHPWEYLAASAGAAAINYPLWRASAMAQSGFNVTTATTIARLPIATAIPASISPYVYAFAPPYKGMVGVVLGMTWARAVSLE